MDTMHSAGGATRQDAMDYYKMALQVSLQETES